MNKREILDELDRLGLLRRSHPTGAVGAGDLPSRAAANVRPVSELRQVLQRKRW
jgi:hypothetical protein